MLAPIVGADYPRETRLVDGPTRAREKIKMVTSATHGLSNGSKTLVDRPCPTCGGMPRVGVYRSGHGYYVGSWCRCGPYSRDSGYYPSREGAEMALPTGASGRP